MKNLREMLGKRAELVTQARAIDEKAEKESRKLSAEETANFDRAIADADAIDSLIAVSYSLKGPSAMQHSSSVPLSINEHRALDPFVALE